MLKMKRGESLPRVLCVRRRPQREKAEWGARCRRVTRENPVMSLAGGSPQAGVKLPEQGTGAEQGAWEGAGVAAWNRPVWRLRSLNEKPSLGVFFKKQQTV